MSISGALVGLMMSSGITLVVIAVLAHRPIPIHRRLQPYLGGLDHDDRSRDENSTTLGSIYGPLVRRLIRVLTRQSDPGLERRLIRAGERPDVVRFRLSQVTAASVTAGSGLLLCLVLVAAGREFAVVPALLLIVLAGSIGWLGADYQLTRRIGRRNDLIRSSLPPVAELLALAVASGESTQSALERVVRTMSGPLADECAQACAETSTGVGFIESLEHMADRCDVPSIRRFVDGISIAVSRGTPLADVLRAQAADARADHHRLLLEAAGRKEVLMLIPLVFLILPTVVLVALFPAMSALTSVAP